MKRIYRHSTAASLFFLSALLLWLSSCQSSDNTETVQGSAVSGLPLKVQIENTSSRVGMTDSYTGTFSYYWSLDKLNIYHQYVLSGAVQNMMSLSFSTTATSGTSATFSCTNGGTYRYNPGMRLYAFSSNTSGGYTASVTSEGVSTFTALTLASQLGTLTDCAKYDALYGSTMVDFATGLPESLTMHHLFGMLNIHLTNSSFSTSYPVTVTLNSSAGNILPGNSGSANFAADGTTITRTGSWGTNWYATMTPTTNGVVDVYLMTWPFSSINGTFTVSCSDASSHSYVARSVTLSGFSLAAAQLKSKLLAISSASTVTGTTYSKLYTWDATNSLPVTLGTAPTNANTTTKASSSTDYIGRALYACASCPNGYAITWYLKVPCYWDSGSISGGNTTNYTMANGGTTKAGIWFRKKSGISGFSSTASSGTTTCTPTKLSTMSAPAISALNLSTNYFFLPAIGTSHADGTFYNAGVGGSYWSSTPDFDSLGACGLYFTSTSASFTENYIRANGFSLWQAQ